MKITEWEGTIDLVVVPMDDYNIVLGMEFLDEVRPWSFENDNTMRITKGTIIHIVPPERSRTRSRTLSTMKFNKDLKQVVKLRYNTLSWKKEHNSQANSNHNDRIKKYVRPNNIVQGIDTCRCKMGSRSPLRIGLVFHEATRRPKIGKVVRKQVIPHLKDRYTKRLDVDIKGLSGGRCHGPSFWKIPRSFRELWHDQIYLRRL